MKIRTTAKLAERIHAKLRSSPTVGPVPFFEEWGAHLFVAGRSKYLMFTEGLTFFSVVVSASGVNDLFSFRKAFSKAISLALVSLIEGGPQELRVNEVDLVKTENNALRRAQTDMIYHAQHLILDGLNTFEINRIPLKSLGYAFPVNRFVTEVGYKLKSTGDLWNFVPD